MTENQLRSTARTMNASTLARKAGVGEVELRRWVAGGVNSTVAAAVKSALEE